MSTSLAVSATVQTQFQFSAGSAVGNLKPQKRTFSLTGVMGTAIQPGDQIAIWGSNDGGTTYQPLRQGNNAPVQLNFNNPEVVIDDCCTHYATQRMSVGTGSTLAACGVTGEAASQPLVQAGTATLAAGTVVVSGVALTATSRILVTMKDPGTAAITGLGALDVPNATRSVAGGTFVVNAIDDSKNLINTAISTFDWIIVG